MPTADTEELQLLGLKCKSEGDTAAASRLKLYELGLKPNVLVRARVKLVESGVDQLEMGLKPHGLVRALLKLAELGVEQPETVW